jgi:hypothetical protein
VKLPALTALIHVDLTGYPHTLLALRSAALMHALGFQGCHCPFCCINGIRYRPCSSHVPISIGMPLHVMSTSCSFCTVTPSLVNIEMVPSSEVLPTLISDVGKSSKVSAWFAFDDSCWNGSWVTCFAILLPPLATPTRLVDRQSIGSPAAMRSCSLM